MTAKTRRKLKNSFLIFPAVYRVGIYPTIAFAMFHNRATIRMCNFMSGKCETVNNANATHIYHIHILTIPYTPTHIHITYILQFSVHPSPSCHAPLPTALWDFFRTSLNFQAICVLFMLVLNGHLS